MGEFEKCRRLTREIVPADHCTFPVLPIPHTSRWNRDFVPAEMYKSVLKGKSGTLLAGPSIANRRCGRKFKFLECEDDNSVASLAKEKSGFGLDRRARNLAGVADLTSRPHLLHFRFGRAAFQYVGRGNDYRRWQFHYQQIRTAITALKRPRPPTEAGLRWRRT